MYKAFRLLVSGCAFAVVLAACSSNSTTSGSPNLPNTAPATNNNGATGYSTYANLAASSFGATITASTASWADIVQPDAAQNLMYVADSTDKGVTVISSGGTTGSGILPTFVQVAGKGFFTGRSRTIPSTFGPGASLNGPNGIAPVGGGVVFTGDGNSNIQVVNAVTGQILTPTPANCQNAFSTMPATGITTAAQAATPVCGIWTGGTDRADENAYDSADNLVLTQNCCENGFPTGPTTPFATISSAAAPYATTGTVSYTDAVCGPTTSTGGTAGAEAPIFDPNQKVFIVTIPCSTVNASGEVVVINPKTATILKTYPEPTGCAGNGLALNPSTEVLMIGCSGVGPTGSIAFMNATNGQIVSNQTGTSTACPAGTPATNLGAAAIYAGGLGGADEVWYNPTDNRFFSMSGNNANCNYGQPPGNGAVFVFDGSSLALISSIPTSVGAHSGAVDPNTNKLFVAERPSLNGGNPITVFSH
jgi:hypothetical protein